MAERARRLADHHLELRAAAAPWVVLITTNVGSARRAFDGFGSPRTQSDADTLLGRLAELQDYAVAFGLERPA